MRDRKKKGCCPVFKRLTPYVLTVTMAMQPALSAYGAENVVGPSGRGYDAETWAALTDDVLEYDELADRIHEFNSNFNSAWKKIEETQEDMRGYVEDLENAQFKMKQLEGNAKDSLKQGDLSAMVDYKTYNALTHSMNKIIGGYQSAATSTLMNTSTSKSIRQGENSVLKIAQQLYLSYSSLMRQKTLLSRMSDLYEEQYQIVLKQKELEMVTEKEVLQAEAQRLNAASLNATVENGALSLKPTICTLAGWPADADITIAELPAIDLSPVDQMNLEEDTKKAIGNNQTLISQRHSEKGKTDAGIQARLDYIEEGEQKLTIRMQSLYSDVLGCRSAYEGALAGYEAAKRDRAKYQRMKDLGYLSKADFIGTELAYYQKEAEFYSADNALRSAMAAYDWAVRGFTEIE